MDDGKCRTCWWWCAAGNPPHAWAKGECRRHAPNGPLIIRLANDSSYGGDNEGSWPMTRANDFCGDHEPQEEK